MFKSLSLWEMVRIGGPVMYLLIICSIVSIAIIVERLIYYHQRSRVSREAFMKSIREEMGKGNADHARRIALETTSPFAAVVLAGLNVTHPDEKDVSDTLEREVIIQSNDLERRTGVVGTIGSTAVYIGLLGTVWGIMKTFHDIAQLGSGGINVVIGGVSEALVCTAAALMVAIPAVMAYNYFVSRINGFVVDMELCSSEIAGLIKHQKRSKTHEKTR